MLTASELAFVRRQYNYNRVPNPLVDGLVFAAIAGIDDATLTDRIRQLQDENNRARNLEEN